MTGKITIVLEDEVNCRFLGLTPKLRQLIKKRLEYFLPQAKYTMQYKLGRWDGKKSLFRPGNRTYINLLDRVFPIITDAGYEINIDDLRQDDNMNFDSISEHTFKDTQWPSGHQRAGESIILRDYQVDIINVFLKELRCVQEIATGAGKCLSYGTKLILFCDLNNSFSKLVYEQSNQRLSKTTCCLPIGELFDIYSKYNDLTTFSNNVEYCISGVSVLSPGGLRNINFLIKKYDLEMVDINFQNLSSGQECNIECAAAHQFINEYNEPVMAKDLDVGVIIQGINKFRILSIGYLHDHADVYDISIETPNMYYTENGILHHNTLVTAALSKTVEQCGRTLVIVPNTNLVFQTLEDFKTLGLDVGAFYGKNKDTTNRHIISTWQSLDRIYDNKKIRKIADVEKRNDILRMGNEIKRDLIAVMADECHGVKADQLFNILTLPLAHVPLRFGLTGTIPTESFQRDAILSALGPIENYLTAHALQERGILAKLRINILMLQEQIRNRGDYQTEHSYLVTDPNRLSWLSRFIKKVSKDGNTLILIDRIQTGKLLSELIGDSAIFVYGQVDVKERKEHYDNVADSNNKIIISTYKVASVGINIPRIFNLILLEPGKSFVQVIQSIGRGIRVAKDKNFVQIYDVASNCKYSTRHKNKRKQFYKTAQYPFEERKVFWNKSPEFN